MKTLKFLLCVVSAILTATVFADSRKPSQEVLSTISAMKRAADFQMANPSENTSTRAWTMAPFYCGLIELSQISGDPKYWAETIRHGEGAGWTLNDGNDAVALAWLKTHIAQKSDAAKADVNNTRMVDPAKKIIDARIKFIEEAKKNGNLQAYENMRPKTSDLCGELFAYCAPLASLFAATGDVRYSEMLGQAYRSFDPAKADAFDFAAIALILKSLPYSDKSYVFFDSHYQKIAERVLSRQSDDGMWDGCDLQAALYAYGIALGSNTGKLSKDKYWPAALKTWSTLNTKGADLNLPKADGIRAAYTGAFILLGCEVAKAFGASPPKGENLLFKAAESVYMQPKIKAYAHIEPRRADDLAWENDKMAFRIYGPALYKGIENSGIDVWVKSVDYPVIDKWYRLDLLKISMYHTDIGEGLDDFSVGDSVGCGGDVIIKGDKIYRGNVYKNADILWTAKDNLKFVAYYLFEDVEGEKISQRRTITLQLGSDRCEMLSEYRTGDFTKEGFEPLKPAADIEVAGGVRPQTSKPELFLNAQNGNISTSEPFAGKILKMYFEPNSGSKFVRFLQTDKEKLAVLKTDNDGKIGYRFGFEWKN